MILSLSLKISEVPVGAMSYHLWMGGIVVFFGFRIFSAVVAWEQFYYSNISQEAGKFLSETNV